MDKRSWQLVWVAGFGKGAGEAKCVMKKRMGLRRRMRISMGVWRAIYT
jgi:hypothetical protein